MLPINIVLVVVVLSWSAVCAHAANIGIASTMRVNTSSFVDGEYTDRNFAISALTAVDKKDRGIRSFLTSANIYGPSPEGSSLLFAGPYNLARLPNVNFFPYQNGIRRVTAQSTSFELAGYAGWKKKRIVLGSDTLVARFSSNGRSFYPLKATQVESSPIGVMQRFDSKMVSFSNVRLTAFEENSGVQGVCVLKAPTPSYAPNTIWTEVLAAEQIENSMNGKKAYIYVRITE